ncbi:MAG TPA: response regulator, partial [Nitrososphaera sp.]|nr:response regulator [Nitrososphaera sp.]
ARFFQEPRKALEDFKGNPKRYMAIVVDARMPAMTGFEFARRVRKLCAEIRIILLTDFEISKSEFKKVFPSSQIDDIVLKPTAAQQLMQAVMGTTKVDNERLSNEDLHGYQSVP